MTFRNLQQICRSFLVHGTLGYSTVDLRLMDDLLQRFGEGKVKDALGLATIEHTVGEVVGRDLLKGEERCNRDGLRTLSGDSLWNWKLWPLISGR